jgi:hypothetical protein
MSKRLLCPYIQMNLIAPVKQKLQAYLRQANMNCSSPPDLNLDRLFAWKLDFDARLREVQKLRREKLLVSLIQKKTHSVRSRNRSLTASSVHDSRHGKAAVFLDRSGRPNSRLVDRFELDPSLSIEKRLDNSAFRVHHLPVHRDRLRALCGIAAATWEQHDTQGKQDPLRGITKPHAELLPDWKE